MRNNKNNITSGLENIISFSRNITSHFTGKAKIITLVLIIIVLSFVNATFTSALLYQSNVGIGFAFNPTLSVSISPSNLVIDSLTPSITADSNAITVSVATNAAYGYTLSAIMNGNNSNLTHTNGTNVFSSIDTDSSLPSLTTDNTWGYSTSTDDGTTWSTYSGLSHTTTKPLLDISDPATPSSIDFKIAARSSTTQASGAYNNVITFYAVGKPYTPPSIDDLTYLQDFATLPDADKQVMIEATPAEVVYTLKDQRDNQDYTIAKLKDGKIWMTKNLNLAGRTALSADTTDVDSSYISSFSTSNNLTKENNTIKLPASATAGFNSDNYSYVYNTGNNTSNCSSLGCYSYYSWDAATLGSGRGISTENTDAPYSICPKGWRLPTSGNSSNGEWKRGDFYALATAYGADLENSYYQSSSTFYNNAGPNTTVPNFLLAGYYYSSSFYGGGSYGRYWSSTSYRDSNYARYLYVYSSSVYSADYFPRWYGFSVRCLVAE